MIVEYRIFYFVVNTDFLKLLMNLSWCYLKNIIVYLAVSIV